MEFLNKKAVLCISPHPDDTEYSMMGTIAQFTDTKFICLNLAIGGHLDDTTSIKRIEEVDNVWKEMNCNNVENVYIDEAQYMEDLKEEEWINSFVLDLSLDSVSRFPHVHFGFRALGALL